MVKQRKVQWVQELTDQLREHPDLVFTSFKGLSVHEMEELRRSLYEKKSRYHVVKNRLALRAFEETLSGPEDAPPEESPEKGPESARRDVSLEDVPGVGPSKLEDLKEAGIGSVSELIEAEEETLTDISGIGAATAEKMQTGARELLEEAEEVEPSPEEPEPAAPADEDVDEETMQHIQDFLTGNTGIAFSGNGFVGTAQVLVEFSEQYEELRIKGGMLNGQILDEDTVRSISKLPSRRELLTKLAMALKNPLQRLARGLHYPVQNLANVLNQVKQQKESNS